MSSDIGSLVPINYGFGVNTPNSDFGFQEYPPVFFGTFVPALRDWFMLKWNLVRYGDVGVPCVSEDLEESEQEKVSPGSLYPHLVRFWKENCDGE